MSSRVGKLREAAGKELGHAVTELTRSPDELERLTLPLERARTLLGLGIAQRRARQRRAARETLGRAIRGFEELGVPLGGNAPVPNSAGSAAVHRRARSGRPRSSASPARCRGRTNREVARVLFVTPRTVEGTLARVYAKLGLRSLAELARYWAARESQASRDQSHGVSTFRGVHCAPSDCASG